MLSFLLLAMSAFWFTFSMIYAYQEKTYKAIYAILGAILFVMVAVLFA